MEVNKLKEIRKALNMNQTEFAAALGISQGNVSYYESQNITPSGTLRTLLISKFGVSDEWLETGEGDIFAKLDDDISKYVKAIAQDKDDDFIRTMIDIISIYTQLDDTSKKALNAFIHRLKTNFE